MMSTTGTYLLSLDEKKLFCDTTFTGVEAVSDRPVTVEACVRNNNHDSKEEQFEISLRIGDQRDLPLLPKLDFATAFKNVSVQMETFQIRLQDGERKFDSAGILSELITQTGKVLVEGSRETGTITITLNYMNNRLSTLIFFNSKYYRWTED